MASSLQARRLTETHRLAQARLGAATIRQLLAAWALLQGDKLDKTLTRWLRVVFPIIAAQRVASAQIAAGYIATFRALELGGPDPGFAATTVSEFDAKQLATSMTVTGPVAVKNAMARGLSLDAALSIGAARSAAAGMRYALDAGRETILTTVAGDDEAVGWARAASGRACAFCAMLASRGPVYREETVAFKTHDHCSCTVEPVYRRSSSWPAGSERYRDVWDRVTGGKSGDDAINAFRQELAHN